MDLKAAAQQVGLAPHEYEQASLTLQIQRHPTEPRRLSGLEAHAILLERCQRLAVSSTLEAERA